MFIKILMLIVFHLKGFTIDSVVSATSESSFLSFVKSNCTLPLPGIPQSQYSTFRIHPHYKEKKSQHCWLLYLLFFIDFLNVLLQSHSHGWGLRIGCLNV